MPDKISRYEDAVLKGTARHFKFKEAVKELPEKLYYLYAKNAERFGWWKSNPEWLKN